MHADRGHTVARCKLTLSLSYQGELEQLWEVDVNELLEIVEELHGEVKRHWLTDDGQVLVEIRVIRDDTP